MTKITVFGQEESKKEEKKAIELVYVLDVDDGKVGAGTSAKQWENICLLGKADCERIGYDLIMAWDNDSLTKVIYLGHWNDGVV